MSTATDIERLEAMPDCPFATDSCFCTEHFANNKKIGAVALDTQIKNCPQGKIMRLGKNVYMINSIFTDPNRKKR